MAVPFGKSKLPSHALTRGMHSQNNISSSKMLQPLRVLGCAFGEVVLPRHVPQGRLAEYMHVIDKTDEVKVDCQHRLHGRDKKDELK